jgi:hypothetical protein
MLRDRGLRHLAVVVVDDAGEGVTAQFMEIVPVRFALRAEL